MSIISSQGRERLNESSFEPIDRSNESEFSDSGNPPVGPSSGGSIFSRFGNYLKDGFHYDCSLGSKLIGGADSSLLRKGVGALGAVVLVAGGFVSRITGVAALVSMATSAISSFAGWVAGKVIDVFMQKLNERKLSEEVMGMLVDQLQAMARDGSEAVPVVGGEVRAAVPVESQVQPSSVVGGEVPPVVPVESQVQPSSIVGGEVPPVVPVESQVQSSSVVAGEVLAVVPVESRAQPSPVVGGEVLAAAPQTRAFPVNSDQLKRDISRLFLEVSGGNGAAALVRLIDTPAYNNAIEGILSRAVQQQAISPDNITAIRKLANDYINSTEFHVLASESGIKITRNVIKELYADYMPYITTGMSVFTACVAAAYVMQIDEGDTIGSSIRLSSAVASGVVAATTIVANVSEVASPSVSSIAESTRSFIKTSAQSLCSRANNACLMLNSMFEDFSDDDEFEYYPV